MHEFEIDRKKWLRNSKRSCLLNDEGKQCCVGHYLTSLGVPNTDLKYRALADGIADLPDTARWLTEDNVFGTKFSSKAANTLYGLNDQVSDDFFKFDNEVQEALVQQIFAENGVIVTFKG